MDAHVQNETPAHLALPADIIQKTNTLGLRWGSNGKLYVGHNDQLSDSQVDALFNELKRYVNVDIKPVPVKELVLMRAITNTLEFYNESNVVQSIRPNSRNAENTVAELVATMIVRAAHSRASDIHIEPFEEYLLVRVRVDGSLEEFERLPIELAQPIIGRLKVLAKMNIVERRRPQDGQFTVEVDGHAVDVRLASIATLYGEKMVMRILDTSRKVDNIESMGISATNNAKFQKLITSKHGLIVVAGPTGSGKTTTLNSAVRTINKPDMNVTTLEDPIEYVVEGVNHVNVDESIGAGFAIQLRAILRQDPDVVLVGEIRDVETARIAIQGALAGRLILSSLHAPNAVGVIYRLFQMDIEPHFVAAALKGVVAQRLVRRVCVYCAAEYEASMEEKVFLSKENAGTVMLKTGRGCSICRYTGYLDRVGVFQILDITDEMRELISHRPNPSELAKLAKKQNLISLTEEARELVLQGITTIEEISFLAADDD